MEPVTEELNTAKKPGRPPKIDPNEERFARLEKSNEETNKSIAALVGLVEKMVSTPPAPATPAQVKERDEVAKASSNVISPMAPEWEEEAQKIIGEALDHCEMSYPNTGGAIFTVVIKPEFSNAKEDYLKMYKTDRRSKEIGKEGFEGVKNWCRIVALNLKKK